MKVLADASPLIGLARIGCLHLLPQVFTSVSVTQIVFEEVTVAGKDLPGAIEIVECQWIGIEDSGDYAEMLAVAREYALGMGEVSTALAAKRCNAELVMIDERKGRRFAKALGLEVIGSVGTLEVMFRRKLFKDLRGAYVALLEQGIRIDVRILNESLSRFGLALLP